MYLIIVLIIFLILCLTCSSKAGGNDKYIIYTSNKNKAEEYIRFGIKNLEVRENIDIKEVKGTPEQVIIYKALEMGDGSIVEDTSLDVEGEDVGINIKYLLNEVKNFVGKKATWRVLLGHLKDDKIYIYEGVINGKIVEARGEGFGFDPIFQPDGSELTLAELGKDKDNYSARKLATEKLLLGEAEKIIDVDDVPEWTGEYQ